MNVTGDLIQRLLSAIEVREQAARTADSLGNPMVARAHEAVVKHCEVDRRMVRLHEVITSAENSTADMRMVADEALRILAEGYGLSDHQEGEE